MKTLLPDNFEKMAASRLYKNPETLAQFVAECVSNAMEETAEVGTAKGREEIRSLAAAVGRARMAIMRKGDDLLKPLEDKKVAVREMRKEVEERLKAVQQKVKEPLVQWELDEEIRIQKITNRIDALRKPDTTGTVADLEMHLKNIEDNADFNTADFDEFAEQAVNAYETGIERLHEALSTRRIIEAQEARLQELGEPASEICTVTPASKHIGTPKPQRANSVYEPIAEQIKEIGGIPLPAAQRIVSAILAGEINHVTIGGIQ